MVLSTFFATTTHLLLRKVLAVAGLSLFIVFPELGDRWFRLLGLVAGRIARNRFLAMAVVGLVSLVLSASLGFLLGMPRPYAHDEFSYLLAGDTFAHGRLTNPTHPMWEHFETFHVIQQPTYASKYPPGQGLALALGQTVSGYPIVGVWISTALACAAVCWMMYAWLPPRWALTGALLTALHPVVIEWAQSHWGGSVALGGGALVLGTFGRILRQPRAYHGAVMALGMAVLANSRPYEGLVFCSVVLAGLLWRLFIGRLAASRLAAALAPFFVVLLLAGSATAFYNFRVTGHPLRLPYQVHEAAYAITPLFIWQRPRPEPLYRHQVLRDFHVDVETAAYREQKSLDGWLSVTWGKYSDLAAIYFPTSFRYLILAIVVVAIPPMLRKDSRTTLLLIALAGFVAGTLPEIFMSDRYTAPAASLLFVFILRSLRHARGWTWRGRPVGRSLLRVCLTAAVVGFILSTVRGLTAPERLDLQRWATTRAEMLERLTRQEGRHLVIVRYGHKHSPNQEWVYNEADIDRSKVAWAREMGRDRDRALLEYFQNRHVWLLSVDDDAETPDLIPCPERLRVRS
jgi:hypothetical protein